MDNSNLREFDVTFEDVGYTRSDLTDCELGEVEKDSFTLFGDSEHRLPAGVVGITHGYITEDDHQSDGERKVYACVTLRVQATGEEAAEAFTPPKCC